ncbi:MAG: nucleotide exchange factor GrpE [Candidatus Bathyarchaeota archaeon]|nr:nucleotide exchange factor GrpE [Candidatus Bathyarchaeum sp.]
MTKDSSKEPQKQIQDLEQRLAEEQEKAQDYLRRLKYLQADFENYRKRTERQVTELTVRSNEKLVAALLCVVDDLERALASGKEAADASVLLEGVEMIHQNLTRMLEKEGLEPIDAMGKAFDPELHELVVSIPRSDCEEGIVLEEVRRGFVFKGRVLRPCMVNVSCITEKEEKENE